MPCNLAVFYVVERYGEAVIKGGVRRFHLPVPNHHFCSRLMIRLSKVALPAQHEVISNDGVEAGDVLRRLQIALGVASKLVP